MPIEGYGNIDRVKIQRKKKKTTPESWLGNCISGGNITVRDTEKWFPRWSLQDSLSALLDDMRERIWSRCVETIKESRHCMSSVTKEEFSTRLSARLTSKSINFRCHASFTFQFTDWRKCGNAKSENQHTLECHFCTTFERAVAVIQSYVNSD
jgi:hypothetical protein